MNEQGLKPREARHYFNVCQKTLYNWRQQGKISVIKTKSKQNRYIINDLPTTKRNFIYCRVSTQGQKEDLKRQETLLKCRYPDFECIKDIGSGLNFNRKGFNALLELAIKGEIGTVAVTYKDRLCRFGYPIFEKLIKSANGKLVVLYKEELSAEQELTSDLIAIITCFSAKLDGLRSHTIKKQIKECAKTKEIIQDNDLSLISN